jgi:hypothetical protein
MMRLSVLSLSACLSTLLAVSAAETGAWHFSAKVPGTFSGAKVNVAPLPADGIQPQAAIDANGVIHVVYFTGKPAGGDLSYVKLRADGSTASAPVRVNSLAGSAIASGSVRGAQMSLGRNGRIHVAWHGSQPVSAQDGSDVPVWYTRSADGVKFEPQRAVSGNSHGLDGGSIAADRSGHVAVVWHALGNKPGEDNRTVYLARSSDDGATFSAVAPATTAPVGACGCCGVRAKFDRTGTLHVLYRAATDGSHRDTTWLMVQATTSSAPIRVHPWELQSCPMSTFALTETPDGLLAAWETAQQIYSTTLEPTTGKVGEISAMPGSGIRKHPSVAVNQAGERLIAWTEGTAWNRGGTVAWRLSDRSGAELASEGKAGPVPVWGLVQALALNDGSFLIVR